MSDHGLLCESAWFFFWGVGGVCPASNPEVTKGPEQFGSGVEARNCAWLGYFDAAVFGQGRHEEKKEEEIGQPLAHV